MASIEIFSTSRISWRYYSILLSRIYPRQWQCAAEVGKYRFCTNILAWWNLSCGTAERQRNNYKENSIGILILFRNSVLILYKNMGKHPIGELSHAFLIFPVFIPDIRYVWPESGWRGTHNHRKATCTVRVAVCPSCSHTSSPSVPYLWLVRSAFFTLGEWLYPLTSRLVNRWCVQGGSWERSNGYHFQPLLVAFNCFH